MPRWSYLASRYPAADRARRNAGIQGTSVADCRITSAVRPPWLNEWLLKIQQAILHKEEDLKWAGGSTVLDAHDRPGW